MDIKSFCLDYFKNLKEKKEFNVWKELWKYIKEYKIKEHKISYGIIIIFGVVLLFIIYYFKITIISSIASGVILLLMGFAIFLSINKKKIQDDLIKSYKNFSDDRKKILFHLLKDENKDIENLTRIKSKIEEIKEELNIFSYPIKIKSIAGYMTLGSIVLYGNFIISMLRLYCEKKLGDQPTIDDLISILSISSLIIFLIIFPIIVIINFFNTVYSIFRLRYYDYLIDDLNNAIFFNEDFQNQSN